MMDSAGIKRFYETYGDRIVDEARLEASVF